MPPYKCSQEEGEELAYRGLPLPPWRGNDLIQKYVRIKPDIQKAVDRYVKSNFEQYFIIGVHHRGTDKIIEWPLVAYEKTYQTLNEIMSRLSIADRERLRIYVATDDQYFLTFLENQFPSHVISNNFIRSTDGTPLHWGVENKYTSNYQKGREALIDCLLLSKCHILIRPTSSCLSLMSCCFNPNMPVISLN